MFTIRKAERKQAKLRIGVSGPSGSGKTYSALLLARGMSSDWNKVGLIDTENGSGELYSHLGDYQVITLEAPFTPERYIEAIHEFERAGIETLIIDSVSQEWEGTGGCLDIVDKLGGRYQDWGKVTPRHNSFLQAILQSGLHIITTTRRKQDYEMTKGNDGKVKVEKMGLKEVQRDGFEYELTLAFDVDTRHSARASKDRTGLFMDKPEIVITQKTGEELKDWAESGAKVRDYTEVIAGIKAELKRIGATPKTLKEAQEVILEITSYDYVQDNYDAILESLKEFESAKKEPEPKVVPVKKSAQSKLDKALKNDEDQDGR